MADYAGAVAAIRDRFRANWTSTPVCYSNPNNFERPTDPNSGNPMPWVFFEVIGNGSFLRAVGKGSTQEWLYYGHILAHVFVAIGDGPETAETYAVAAGEIFRAKQFYDDTPGHCVRTGYGGNGPRPDGGGKDADDGLWFRVTMTVPFEYYFRG